MSKGSQRLRALVTERLTAAVEEIFVLVERTIAEYEEELCRSKEENQRKQQLLDSALSKILVHRSDAQVQTETEAPCPQQETSQSLKLEEQPEVPTQTFDCYVKPESEEADNGVDVEPPDDDAGLLLKSESEEVQEEPTTNLLSSLDFESCSSILTPTEATNRTDAAKKHECVFCGRRFREEYNLQRHIVVHTRQKPFVCSVCSRSFSQEETLRLHMALHSEGGAALASDGARHGAGAQASAAGPAKVSPFCCPVCQKCFTRTFSLQSHMLTHTGEKPFPCPLCSTRFNRKSNLNRHLKVHAQKFHSV